MTTIELHHGYVERGGVQYWAVFAGTHATYLEHIPRLGLLTGVFTCQTAPEGTTADHDNCPWLGRCTTDAFVMAETDKVRARFEAIDAPRGSDDHDVAVFALLAELHAELVTR